MIATQGVAQSEPDGHTILFGTTGNLAVNPVLYAGRPGMNMEREFAPLSQVASLAFVLVVNPSVPAKSLAGADRAGEGEARARCCSGRAATAACRICPASC